jgi:ketosteroid isomerase-like protein
MAKDLGSQYVQAVSQGDFTRLHDLFSDDIRFPRTATQGDSWHAIGWSDTEKALRELYPPNELFSEVVMVDHHDVPGRYRISYRLRGHKLEHGTFEYEHQVYYNTEGNKINRLRVLCSGIYEPEYVTG